MSPGRSRGADLAARAAAVASAGRPDERQADAPDPVGAQVRKSADAEVLTPGQRPAAARTTSPPAAPRTRPVRVTVELAPIEHRRLRRLCERYADETGAPQVAGAEVFRVLLALVDRDPELAARVGEELRRTGGSRRRWS